MFVLWLSLGQNFSGLVKQAPYLPLGPTDQCLSNITTYETNVSLVTSIDIVLNTTTVATSSGHGNIYTTELVSRAESGVIGSALASFYSISYMYFDLIGVSIVLLVGSLVSLLSKPHITIDDKHKYVLPFSALVPRFLKKICCRHKEKEHLKADDHELERMFREG